MGVEVDQPGYDEQPADIDGLGTAGGDDSRAHEGRRQNTR
jgi:hypothetical protein